MQFPSHGTDLIRIFWLNAEVFLISHYDKKGDRAEHKPCLMKKIYIPMRQCSGRCFIRSLMCLVVSATAVYSQTTTLQWARRMGGTAFDDGHAVVLDAAGNVYSTGLFQGTADFGCISASRRRQRQITETVLSPLTFPATRLAYICWPYRRQKASSTGR